jgi:hypothetical protein
MSGPAGLDVYSNCMDISALVITTARDVVVPGNYDVRGKTFNVCVAGSTAQGLLHRTRMVCFRLRVCFPRNSSRR